MQAGKLNTRIRIDGNVETLDDYGATVTGWETIAETWANVRHINGKEAIAGDAIVSTARASMRIRWRAGLTPGMRVTVMTTGQVYDVRAVLPDVQGREHIDLVCEATS